jgi:capsular polysaccharide biosynthesis protein
MLRDDVFLELRAYLEVLRRRWLLILLPALVVLIGGAVTFRPPESSWRVGMRYIVGQPPTISADVSERERSFVWITSQYVVNSITDWANGTDFAHRVAEEARLMGVEVDQNSFYQNSEALTIRSRLTLLIDHDDEAELLILADAATRVLLRDNNVAIPQVGDVAAEIRPIDIPNAIELKPGLSAWLTLPLRVIVALGAGIALAFLIEYLDPKVRTRRHVQALHLPVLGQIPGKSN